MRFFFSGGGGGQLSVCGLEDTTSLEKFTYRWSVINPCLFNFQTPSQNCEKRLLPPYCLSVSPASWLPLDGPSWYFMFEYFSKLYRQNSLKSENIRGNFTWGSTYICDNISLNFSRMRNVSDKICIENQNALFIFNNFFTVYETMWKNMVQPERPHITI